MKKKELFPIGILIATIIFISGCSNSQPAMLGPSDTTIDYQTFYDDLSPYGTWIDYPGYGEVWNPNLGGEFRPYLTNGYWSNTSLGNMWMSDYNWGWAPFHYGRWTYDNLYGWLWVPGYEWAPAWVTWGYTDGFYCWAPLLPNVNVGVRFNTWRPSAFYWNALNQNHIYDRDINNYVETRQNVETHINNINIINNFNSTRVHDQYYSKGPDLKDVEERTGKTYNQAEISDVRTPQARSQEGNAIKAFRPSVVRPQPQQISRMQNEVSPVRNREEEMVAPRPEIPNARPEMSVPREEQIQNISRMPVHVAPAGSFQSRSFQPIARPRH